MILKLTKFVSVIFITILIMYDLTHSQMKYYDKSYALVIGINKYPFPDLLDLSYAVNDAKGIAAYLRVQGFEVDTLYDEQATKNAIISKMQNYLAPSVKQNDRILFFFAGHGYTETLADQKWGYIVPYDGTDQSSTYISMEELRTLSSKMGNANHQLFIMDACYGGLLGKRNVRLPSVITPSYIRDAIRRVSRQIITAGGREQPVIDRYKDGHSLFTGYLLKALEKGIADINRDGFITAIELYSFLETSASNDYQTPVYDVLPGHEQGDFVFNSPIIPEPVEITSSIYGNLIIQIPFKADIYINGQLEKEQTTYFEKELKRGQYKLEIKSNRRRPFRTTISIEEGKTDTLRIPRIY